MSKTISSRNYSKIRKIEYSCPKIDAVKEGIDEIVDLFFKIVDDYCNTNTVIKKDVLNRKKVIFKNMEKIRSVNIELRDNAEHFAEIVDGLVKSLKE